MLLKLRTLRLSATYARVVYDNIYILYHCANIYMLRIYIYIYCICDEMRCGVEIGIVPLHRDIRSAFNKNAVFVAHQT